MKEPKQNKGALSGSPPDVSSFGEIMGHPYVNEETFKGIKHGIFGFRTLEEARLLCELVSSQTNDPIIVGIGLIELMVNAIEHGNLEITYDEKGLLLKKGIWQKEVLRRLDLPKYKNRMATLMYDRSDKLINVLITDEGDGFDSEKFLQNQTQVRKEDSSGSQYHGRGIAVASQLDFENIEYLGNGNQVRVSILAKE